MQIFNQYLDRFPPPEQQIIRDLLQQYESAGTPQDQALAQRRLEPYSRQIMQMASRDRQIGNPYLSQTNLNIENKYPGGPPPALPDDPIEVMDRSRPLPDVSRMTPQFPAAYSDSPVPGTTEMMSARDSLNEDADRRAMAIIAEAKRKRDAAQSSAPRLMGPANPPRNTSPFNYNVPAAPKTSAAQSQSAPAQGGGLLDIDTDFFDDPTRMGLLQAGLGLMSAPRYSTNPNDVTLSSALARGLGGYIQGYGGTKKRLSEAERQRIEDDWKRTQMEKDFEYKDALIQMYGIQGEAQRKNAELNATEKQLQKQAIAAQVERILEHEGKLGNTTRRLELNRLGTSDNTNQQNQFADLYRESVTDRTPMEETLVASGKYTEEDAKKLRFTALETQYNKILDLQTNPPKPTSVSQGARERYSSDLQKVVGDPSLLNTPFHENAWALYYQTELDPKVSQDSVITKPSIYPVPDKYKYLFDSAQVEGKSVDNMGGYFVTSKPSDAQSKQINSALADLAAVQKVEDQVIKIGIPNLEERLKQNDPEVARLASQYGNMLMQLKESYNLGVLQELDKQEMQNIINDPTDPKSIRNIMRTVPLFTAQANVVKEAILDRNRPLANQYNINLENRFAQTYPSTQLTFSVPANLPKNQSKLDKRTDEILQGTGPIDVAPLQLNNGNDSEVPFYERWYNNLTN